MKKIFLSALFILFLTINAFAAEDNFDKSFAQIEKYLREHRPGLKNYVCDVKTTQFETMMKKMTSAMPEDLPRPEKPTIKKYWDSKKGMVIRLEGKNIFPYMKDISKKMSEQFALELYDYFLPYSSTALRRKLLKNAEKRLEIVNGYHRFYITFKDKTDIKDAFFKGGLPIPTNEVKSLVISVDMGRKIVKDVYIQYDKEEGYKEYKLLAEYKKADSNELMYNIYLMADDHSVMIGFRTEFDKIDGYFLPIKQIRTGEGINVPEEEKRVEVEFVNYKINQPLPANVFGVKKRK